jgi:hypothetical protein
MRINNSGCKNVQKMPRAEPAYLSLMSLDKRGGRSL